MKILLLVIITIGILFAGNIDDERFDILYHEKIDQQGDTLYIGVLYDRYENKSYLIVIASRDYYGLGVSVCPLEEK